MARLYVASYYTDILSLTAAIQQQPVILGSLTTLFHQTRGTVYAINEKTFYIENFDYDGQGIGKSVSPDSYIASSVRV